MLLGAAVILVGAGVLYHAVTGRNPLTFLTNPNAGVKPPGGAGGAGGQ